MIVILELFICAIEREDVVRFHHLQHNISDTVNDPDCLMREQLFRLGLLNGSYAQYAHGTSWRYEAGQTVLTYLVLVDLKSLDCLPTQVLSISNVICSKSKDTLSPRPEKLGVDQVLVHGLRHFRYLMFDCGDQVIANAIKDQPTLHLFSLLAPAPAGRIGKPKWLNSLYMNA